MKLLKYKIILIIILLLSNCVLFDNTDIDIYKQYRVTEISRSFNYNLCVISIAHISYNEVHKVYEEVVYIGYNPWFYAECNKYNINEIIEFKVKKL